MKALVLAAGYSTRLYPLTLNTPKALLPIGDRPMLDYLMAQIATIPVIDEAYIVTNARFAGQFADWAKSAQPAYPRMKLTVLNDGTSTNETRLGAIGDIQFSIDEAKIDDELLIAASDDFFTFPLTDFYDDYRAHGCDTLLGERIASLTDLRRFAVAVLDENRRVLSLIEKPQEPPSDVAVYALYFYRRDTLPLFRTYLDEGNPSDSPGNFPVWLCKKRDVRCYIFTGECIDIGTVESYRDVCARYGGKTV